MTPFKKRTRLYFILTTCLFFSCSPQKKVQQYSYLVKHKASNKIVATAGTNSDLALLSPVAKEEKIVPVTTGTKEVDPIAKTEVKESIDVTATEAPKVSVLPLMPVVLGREETQTILQTADKYLGTPYKYAGMTDSGIDCSGLICQAYNAAGIALPRSSWAMAKSGKEVALKEVAPGHLLFFHSYKGKGVNHVAMVSQIKGTEIEFIHATVSNGVRKDKLSDPYWKDRFRKAVVPVRKK